MKSKFVADPFPRPLLRIVSTISYDSYRKKKNIILRTQFIMFKTLIYLGLLVRFLRQPTIQAFRPITQNNLVLVRHAFQQLHARDWFNCIQACHDEPRCISYNYQRSAATNGLCELNDCEVESFCDRLGFFIYSEGFVFQQIRESKVRLYFFPITAVF